MVQNKLLKVTLMGNNYYPKTDFKVFKKVIIIKFILKIQEQKNKL